MCLFFKHIDHDGLGLKNGGFPQKCKNIFHPITPCTFAENKGFQAYQKRGFAKDTPTLCGYYTP